MQVAQTSSHPVGYVFTLSLHLTPGILKIPSLPYSVVHQGLWMLVEYWTITHKTLGFFLRSK